MGNTVLINPQELKPCPFCNGNAIFRTASFSHMQDGCGIHFSIKCAKCGAEVPSSKLFEVKFTLLDNGEIRICKDERLEASMKWNARGGED